MEKGCNIREVAKKAGVSPGTVSRVLNNRMGKMQVSDVTRKLIFQCAEDLDYQPNINARRLFSNRSGVLGFVIPSFREVHKNVFGDIHIINLLNGIEEVLAVRKYKLMILFKDREFIDSHDYLSLFRSKQVDGLLIWGSHRSETFWNELSERNYPHVFVTTYPDGLQRMDSVFAADYTGAGYDIMNYLLKKKYRNILWAKPQDDTSISSEIKAGIDKSLRENPGLCQFREIPCPYSQLAGFELMEKIHRTRLDFSVVLFTSHEAATGAMDYCVKHGIRVPEEIAVAACDSPASNGALTRITAPAVDDCLLGINAVEALVASIENRECRQCHRARMVLNPGDTA